MTKIKYLLTMDTSGGSASACVYDCENNISLADNYSDTPYNQGEIIIPMIDDVIKKSGIKKSQIDAIGVCRGPGFFTGMRIGMATAQSLALGLGVDLYAVDSLSVVALEVDEDNLTVLSETKRSDICVADFNNGKIIGEIKALEIDEINIPENNIITGSALRRYVNATGAKNKIIEKDFPTSVGIAKLIVKNGFTDTDITPIYQRNADVSKPKAK